MHLTYFSKLIVLCGVLISTTTSAQVKVSNGPELGTNNDNIVYNVFPGDEKYFYCYRGLQSKKDGKIILIEQYDKATLKRVFTKKIALPKDIETYIEGVFYSNGNIYIFETRHEKIPDRYDRFTLFYQTISSSGELSPKPVEIISVESISDEFAHFHISFNSNKSKFLITALHKLNEADNYKAEFIVLDGGMQKLWSKAIDNGKESMDNYFGTYLDDTDNLYFGSLFKEKKQLKIGILKADENVPKIVNVNIDEHRAIDPKFTITNKNQIVVGGFFYDVLPRRGRDLTYYGAFNFTIDMTTYSVVAKQVKSFDEQFLKSLEFKENEASVFEYKMDYVQSIGNDVYFIGEQYKEWEKCSTSSRGTSYGCLEKFEYMDVIISKVNAKGEVEWIKNIPMRWDITRHDTHIFKLYMVIPTDKNLYILYNEHPSNMRLFPKSDFDPKDLKSISQANGTNFVFTSVNLVNGSMKHGLIFENDPYSYAPLQDIVLDLVPFSNYEFFALGNNNEIFIYTENDGNDRFCKIKLE